MDEGPTDSERVKMTDNITYGIQPTGDAFKTQAEFFVALFLECLTRMDNPCPFVNCGLYLRHFLCRSAQETLSTLRFAQHAKLMRNKAVINEHTLGSTQAIQEQFRRLQVFGCSSIDLSAQNHLTPNVPVGFNY